MMKTLILTIGNEVTSGHTVNSNASFIAEAVEAVGITPERVVTMRDDETALTKEIKEALANFKVVIITGGLGPTHDDVTKPAICKAIRAPLVRDRRALLAVKRHFKKLGKVMPPINENQADIPKGTVPLYNRIGTAPGIFYDSGSCLLFALPGVPSEMKMLMKREVVPILEERTKGEAIERSLLKTVGIAESALYTTMREAALFGDSDVEIAFLPRTGEVDIRLTVKADNRKRAQAKLKETRREVKKVIKPWYYGKGSETLESVIGKRFAKNKITLASAESCTGGLFASTLTSVAGASEFYLEGVITYSNESKMKRVKVKEKTLIDFGAVSEEVAMEMAKGVRRATGADVGISATGVAGPGGGTKEKPVGTIYIGLSYDNKKTVSKKLNFGFDRKTNQSWTVRTMLTWLFMEMQNFDKREEIAK